MRSLLFLFLSLIHKTNLYLIAIPFLHVLFVVFCLSRELHCISGPFYAQAHQLKISGLSCNSRLQILSVMHISCCRFTYRVIQVHPLLAIRVSEQTGTVLAPGMGANDSSSTSTNSTFTSAITSSDPLYYSEVLR